MYVARSIAAISLVIIVSGLLRPDWIVISLGAAGLILASYVALVFERKVVKARSFASQVALVLIGALVLAACYFGFERIMSANTDPSPDPVIVVGGFMLLALVIPIGVTMLICGLTSRKNSHRMLLYFVNAPDRRKGRLL